MPRPCPASFFAAPTFISSASRVRVWCSSSFSPFQDRFSRRRRIMRSLSPRLSLRASPESSGKIEFGCPARQGGKERGLLPDAAPILYRGAMTIRCASHSGYDTRYHLVRALTYRNWVS